jgi:hypothetical protein
MWEDIVIQDDDYIYEYKKTAYKYRIISINITIVQKINKNYCKPIY